MSATLAICIGFVSLICGINVCAGMLQAWRLSRIRIGVCEGRIISAELVQGRELAKGSQRITTFVPAMKYTYLVRGIMHTGNRISLAVIGDSNKYAAAKRLMPYTEGASVLVFFDEADPSSSYLVNPRKHILTSILISMGFVLFGFGMVWFLCKMLG